MRCLYSRFKRYPNSVTKVLQTLLRYLDRRKRHSQILVVLQYSGNRLLWKKEAANAGIWNGDNTVISPSVSVDPKGRIFVTGRYQGVWPRLDGSICTRWVIGHFRGGIEED